jgi:hypothetical protein
LQFFEFVAYARFLCFVINHYSSCFGRNILTDPNFDFSPLWPLIVGLLRLVFNLQNYASNIFYLFLHIFSQSSSSLLHPSRVAAAAAYRRSSPPLLAQARSIGSSLVLATISILLLSFLGKFSPYHFFFARRCAPSLRGAAPRAFSAQRFTVRAQRSARGAWRFPCAALCCPARRETAQRGECAGQHRERARASPRVPAP